MQAAMAQPQVVPAPPDAPEEYLFLIKGQTTKGGKFRPSDWADRLIGVSAFYAREHHGNPREISGKVCIIEREGFKSIIVDPELRQVANGLYMFMKNFAKDNKLVIELLDPSEWNRSRRRIIQKPVRQFV